MNFNPQLHEVKGPIFEDDCGHPEGSYVGSFVMTEWDQDDRPHRERYDLYVFPHPTRGQSVCMRYGNEGYQYLSPGPLYSLIQGTELMESYQVALGMLLYYGQIRWTRGGGRKEAIDAKYVT
jgi:hypothetical protein